MPVLVMRHQECVPARCVLGDDAQGPPLARAADPERHRVLQWLRLAPGVAQLEVAAIERRRLLRPEAAADAARLVQHVHPLADPREGDPVLVVLELVPRCAEAELEPSAGDVVDGRGHVREHGRVPVGDTDDDHPAANPRRVRRHGRQ